MNTVITITGPTCSGKTTLARALAIRGFPEVKSFTTRAPRLGEEQHGESAAYQFVTRQWVDSLQPSDVIERVLFNGNVYGNTIQQLRRARLGAKYGITTVVVEPEGVKHWAAAAEKHGFPHHAIYLHQSKDVLIRRFAERLRSVNASAVSYEIARMQNMLDVEYAQWPNAYDYDTRIDGLGESFSSVNVDMVYGFILLGLTKP